ncbi:MAG: bacillithiol system redox-active protein YtxJ [Planctomycetota bacterium]
MLSRLRTADELERALAAPRFLLFKHSTSCPISCGAFEEYEQWLASSPAIPSAWLHVVEERPLAHAVSERTGVRHESPQALLLVDGRCVWNASHGAITQTSLQAALARG